MPLSGALDVMGNFLTRLFGGVPDNAQNQRTKEDLESSLMGNMFVSQTCRPTARRQRAFNRCCTMMVFSPRGPRRAAPC